MCNPYKKLQSILKGICRYPITSSLKKLSAADRTQILSVYYF